MDSEEHINLNYYFLTKIKWNKFINNKICNIQRYFVTNFEKYDFLQQIIATISMICRICIIKID